MKTLKRISRLIHEDTFSTVAMAVGFTLTLLVFAFLWLLVYIAMGAD